MTTLLVAAPTVTNEVPRQLLGDLLRATHALRLGELRQALEPAQAPEAGVWSRWAAARLAGHLLSAWFEPERQMIEAAYHRFGSGHDARLWTAAELVLSLRWQMDHSVGLCHHPAEFFRITLKLETALEHWCDEVEEALAGVSWADLSSDHSEAFASLLEEEPHHVTQ